MAIKTNFKKIKKMKLNLIKISVDNIGDRPDNPNNNV